MSIHAWHSGGTFDSEESNHAYHKLIDVLPALEQVQLVTLVTNTRSGHTCFLKKKIIGVVRCMSSGILSPIIGNIARFLSGAVTGTTSETLGVQIRIWMNQLALLLFYHLYEL